MRLLVIVVITLLGSTPRQAYGQISISFPTSRTVLQRDKNNSATVYIRGSYSQPIDRVEVQLRAINGGNTSNWITIINNPQGGTYAGKFDWTGGWYEMEVRGWLGEQHIGSVTLDRIGIGEVFILGGQSNAQGYFNYGGPGANDDRVNCVNYSNVNSTTYSELPTPEFIHLDAGSNVSPRGASAWAWGRLGDHLTQRLGVPILFYNIAWYGSSIRNWRQSIDGTAYSAYNGEAFIPDRMPYGNLRLVLQQYVSITGARAILWQQGEADNFANTSSDAYKSDLNAIITQSRSETGRNLSWVIARCSYDNQRGTNPQVVGAQDEVVATTPNAFKGPDADKVQSPRPDGVHFQGQGLVDLGDAWNTALNDAFFTQSQPFKSAPSPTIRVSCAGNNNLSLTIEGGSYNTVSWNNGQGEATISVGEGRYSAKVKDASGNIFTTPEVVVPGQVQPGKPTINVEGSRLLCQGGTVNLNSSINENIRWNTGQTEPRIQTGIASNFSVTASNIYGCTSTSDPVNIEVFSAPPPPKPSITALGATTFCEGEQVILQNNQDTKSVWSNGIEGRSLPIQQSGEFRVRSIDTNGCQSPESEPIQVIVNPNPAKPQINLNGSPTLCAGEIVTLYSNYQSNNQWSNSSSKSLIVVNTSGIYSVSVTNESGCKSTSEPVQIKVTPLPATPNITSLGVTTFCEGGQVILQSDQNARNIWSNGQEGQSIVISRTGEFRVYAVGNAGCQSPESEPVLITVNPIPARPQIGISGNTTFCADKNITLTTNYKNNIQWNTNASTPSIVLNKSGEYKVSFTDDNGCKSTSDPVRITVNPLPSTPQVTVLRPTTFCQRDFTVLRSNSLSSYQWSNGENKQEIEVRNSGDYSLTTIDANGCRSLVSKTIKVAVNPAPPRPTISTSGPTTFCSDQNIRLTASEAFRYIWNNGATTQEILTNQSYVYRLQTQNEFGCTSEPSENVAIKALPLPAKVSIIASGRTTFCETDSFRLTATSNLPAFWNSGDLGTAIRPRESGNFTVRVQGTNGCFSPYSDPVTIDIKPTPSSPSINKIGTYTLEASNSISSSDFIWRKDNILQPERSAIFKARASGNYTVQAQIVYDTTLTCRSASSRVFNFITESYTNGISIYPNPTDNGILLIETLENLRDATMIVIDMKGSIVRTFTVAYFNERKSIDLSDLINGEYLVRIQSGTFNAVQKILILR